VISANAVMCAASASFHRLRGKYPRPVRVRRGGSGHVLGSTRGDLETGPPGLENQPFNIVARSIRTAVESHGSRPAITQEFCDSRLGLKTSIVRGCGVELLP
jgi:hypothetical protein